MPQSITTALETGFRAFDTAEADIWYDQEAVRTALERFFQDKIGEECQMDDEEYCSNLCSLQNLQISTKIPPWELTSTGNMRRRAAESREILVGFCDDESTAKFPLDVYYIHAPECWDGWHPRCNGVKDTIPLREAWIGMEAILGQDHNAERIGLSNVWPNQLNDIIRFVKVRQAAFDGVGPPPRMPDVVQCYADPLHPAKELRKICEENGIEFVSYSTLGTQHRMRDGTNPILGDPQINEIAQKYGRSAAEVVLSWALSHGMSVIPRSTKDEHIYELSRLLDGKSFLEAQDLARIDSLALN